MRKILLVDDDTFFRTMFASMLPWGSYGFSLLQAGNGRDAIELLHRNSDIALVFTDMDMPILDGVELIRYITEHCPGIHCIALSAYDDFSYVRPSLKNGADDYLLKHTLTKSQLVQILQQHTAQSQEKGAVKTDNGELTCRFLFDYITGAYRNVPEIDSLFPTLSLPVLTKNLLLMLLMGDTPDGKIVFHGAQKAARNQLNTACCMLQGQMDRIGSGVVFSGQDGLLYLLVTADGFENLQFVKQTAQVLASQVERMMLQYFNLHTHLICAPLCRKGESLQESYRALMQQINHEAANTGGQLEAVIRLPEQDELLDELYFGSEEALRRMVAATYLAGRQHHLSQSRFSELTVAFLQQIAQATEVVQPSQNRSLGIPSGSDSVQEAYVTRALVELQVCAAEAAAARYSPVVMRALQLIHSSYCDRDLSPAAVSEQLRVNPAYLSRLFKSQVDQNISDYISQKRLKRACALLDHSVYTVKEIAALCGYDNYNYFFRVFKKHVGITPKEYRIQAISDRGN